MPGHGMRSARGWRLAAAALGCATLLGARPALAQTGVVGGTVLTEAQMPLANAQVNVAGTTLGTATDASGRFRIAGVSGTQVTLDVKRLGYQPRSVTARVGDTDVRIVMTARALELNSVVVTGTAGGTEKRAVGTAVTQINVSDLTKKAPVPNLQSVVLGRAAGVVMLPSSGVVGGGMTVRIRGSSSLSQSNQPILFVDGVRVDNAQGTGPVNQGFGASTTSRWNDINPEDIESIEIIKGPAAATLYGTEASAGVIQIITKKGSQGKPVWNFTTKQGANWFMNPEGRLWTNYGVDPNTGELSSIDYKQLEKNYGGDIYHTGQLQSYDLSVSGGTPVVNYYVSGGWESNEGAEPNNVLRQARTRANVTVRPSDKIDLSANLGYTAGKTQLPIEAGGGGTAWTTYYATPENLNQYNLGFYSALPRAYYAEYSDFQRVNRFTGSIQVSHRPTTWLTQRLNFGVDQGLEDNQELAGVHPNLAVYFDTDALQGYKVVDTRNATFTTLDYNATARAALTQALTSATSVGAQYVDRNTTYQHAYGENLVAPGLKTLLSATKGIEGWDDYIENKSLGFYVNEQFGWQDRLFFTAAVRGDGNSAFGTGFKAAYYPKASLSWVISEEPFFHLPYVNTLKLRAAYGQSGQQPQAYDALQVFRPVPGPGSGAGTSGAGVTPSAIGNPDLGPERSEETELGFDAGLFDDRAGVEFTYFTGRTRDAILERNVPPSEGYPGTQLINAGQTSKHGFELLLRGTPVRGDRVTWDATLNTSYNTTNVDNLGGATFISPSTYIQHHVGYPIGSWFGRKIVSAQYDAAGDSVYNVQCADGQGGTVSCSSAPNVFLGSTLPKWEGGFGNTVSIGKSLQLYALVDFKTGYKKLDGNRRVRCHLFDECRENYYPEEFDAVTIASVRGGSGYYGDIVNDASYAKLRELSATYTLPGAWASRVGASRASVTLAGRNLHTWTRYPGLEPEASFFGGSRGFGQWEQDVTPQLASFVTTINLSF